MVAEKRNVLRFLGNSAMISFKPSFKIVIISSASSKTKNRVSFRFMALRCIKSISLPGVATTICVGEVNRSICGFIGIPPQVAAMETSGRYLAKASKLLKIWCPNSRVGTNITAWIAVLFVSINCNNGNPKAAVFPVPVFASPTISVVFDKSNGIVFCWISVGTTNFNAVIAFTKGVEIPKSANWFDIF